MAAGAAGFVAKGAGTDALLQVVRQVVPSDAK